MFWICDFYLYKCYFLLYELLIWIIFEIWFLFVINVKMLEIKFFFVLCVGGGLIRMIKGKEIFVEKIKKMKYIIM